MDLIPTGIPIPSIPTSLRYTYSQFPIQLCFFSTTYLLKWNYQKHFLQQTGIALRLMQIPIHCSRSEWKVYPLVWTTSFLLKVYFFFTCLCLANCKFLELSTIQLSLDCNSPLKSFTVIFQQKLGFFLLNFFLKNFFPTLAFRLPPTYSIFAKKIFLEACIFNNHVYFSLRILSLF